MIYACFFFVSRSTECQTMKDTSDLISNSVVDDLPIAGVSQREATSREDQRTEVNTEENTQSTLISQHMSPRQGEIVSPTRNDAELSMKESTALIQAPSKLADSEKRLADEMKMRKEKRIKFKAIIEEEENKLKVLTKQVQSVQDAIKLKELKIKEMKCRRKEMPLLRKFGMQINISKSVLRKERLQDDLSVLRGRCVARRRKIQKYKTKIRYDLQILSDPCRTSINPSPATKPKPKASRPTPACFFVQEDSRRAGMPNNILDSKTQVKNTPLNQKACSSARSDCVVVATKRDQCLGSKWSLDSVDAEEINSLLTRQLQIDEPGFLARSCSSENVRQCPLKLHEDNDSSTKSISVALSSSSISVDVSKD